MPRLWGAWAGGVLAKIHQRFWTLHLLHSLHQTSLVLQPNVHCSHQTLTPERKYHRFQSWFHNCCGSLLWLWTPVQPKWRISPHFQNEKVVIADIQGDVLNAFRTFCGVFATPPSNNICSLLTVWSNMNGYLLFNQVRTLCRYRGTRRLVILCPLNTY